MYRTIVDENGDGAKMRGNPWDEGGICKLVRDKT
jgi:hypothetical protein